MIARRRISMTPQSVIVAQPGRAARFMVLKAQNPGACCKTLDIPERRLGRMFGAEDGVVDRLEFTRAVSGASFFVPSLDTLRGLA
jgi:hypothetical protein